MVAQQLLRLIVVCPSSFSCVEGSFRNGKLRGENPAKISFSVGSTVVKQKRLSLSDELTIIGLERYAQDSASSVHFIGFLLFSHETTNS